MMVLLAQNKFLNDGIAREQAYIKITLQIGAISVCTWRHRLILVGITHGLGPGLVSSDTNSSLDHSIANQT